MNEYSMISGTWLNKNTGQKITVNNTIIDGDEMVLITSIGQLTMNEFTRDYIQVSDDIYNANGEVIDNAPIDNYEVAIQNYDIEDALKPKPQNIESTKIKENKQDTSKVEIIKKFFEKSNSNNQILTVNLDLKNCNISELKIIMEYTGITSKDISEYILNEFLDKDQLKEIINTQIDLYIN